MIREMQGVVHSALTSADYPSRFPTSADSVRLAAGPLYDKGSLGRSDSQRVARTCCARVRRLELRYDGLVGRPRPKTSAPAASFVA